MIGIHVLPDQRDLTHAGVREIADFVEDLLDRARDLHAARVRHHAEGAELVATFLHGDEGRDAARARCGLAREGEESELVLDRELGLDRRRVAREQFGQAVIALRPDHEVDHRRAADDLRAFGLRDAARHRDRDAAAIACRLLLHHPQPPEFRIDLFGRLFADVAGVQDDEVGVFRAGGLDITLGCEQVRHTMGIVGVHLATVGFDVKLASVLHPTRAARPADLT